MAVTEWEVVGVIVVLVGLLISLIRPVVALNAAITRLSDLTNVLERDLEGLAEKNSETHARLWQRAQEQESRLQRHETRLAVLERGQPMLVPLKA